MKVCWRDSGRMLQQRSSLLSGKIYLHVVWDVCTTDIHLSLALSIYYKETILRDNTGYEEHWKPNISLIMQNIIYFYLFLRPIYFINN